MNPDLGRILVADDDAASRIYFSRQLRQQNLSVTTVETGQQAIDHIRNHPFDLVLLDILMPVMNGFKVLEWLKSEPTFSHIPVIMVSGLDDLDSLIHCIELGAEDYLFKPLNPVLLRARINACLERKRLRDQETAYLKQLRAEKTAAEMANRAKSAFLANMSHELRTPLNAIIGYSEILQEDLQTVAADLVPDLDKIRTSGKHLLTLIDDILDLSKIEAGKMELYLESFNLASLVEEVRHTIHPLAQTKGNQLSVSCPPTIGVMHADLNKVRQVLLNLLSNAVKFTEQGQITLTVERCTPLVPPPLDASARSPDPHRHAGDGVATLVQPTIDGLLEAVPAITFTVRDTGIGIHEDVQANIFQLFNQGDNSSTRKYSGTGLGLALTQRYCAMMGGTITVESTLGQGSTFTVQLPVYVAAQPATAALTPHPIVTLDEGQPEAVSLPDAATLVLVIDADRSMRDLMVRTLNAEGCRVVTTWSGEEGLRLARELYPDLIVLDLVMPSVDSWAILSSLSSDVHLARIPVILTAIADNQDLGLTLGMVAALTKPTDFQRLVLQLHHYRNHHQCHTATGSILLVADDGTPRQMVQRLLEHENWIVTPTAASALTVADLDQHRPDLILLDLTAADHRGLAFLAALRQHTHWHDLPVVVLTTKELSQDDRAELNHTIAALLQQGHYSRAKSLTAICKLVASCRPSRSINTASPSGDRL